MKLKSIRIGAITIALGFAACVAVSMGSGGDESSQDKAAAAVGMHNVPVYYAVFLTKTSNWPKDASSPAVVHVNAHRQYMGELEEKGVSLVGGPYYPNLSGAILIMKARDKEEATKLIGDDPAVTNGLFIAEVKPFYAAIRPDAQP